MIGYFRSLLGSSLSTAPSADAAALYLELMKACLTNRIYDDDVDLRRGVQETDPADGKVVCVAGVAPSAREKYDGHIWPSRAHTMIGLPRLNNLQHCIESVLAERVSGDFLEAGVWRGGACIFMRAVLKAHGIADRTVWVADSFEGLPEADAVKHPYDHEMFLHLAGDLAVPLEEVQRNFERYGLLDAQVRFLKGWFRDTLPAAAIDRLAILRADGDHYESTMDILNNLYPKLASGGYAIIDDYQLVHGCNLAIADFRRQHGISEEIHVIPGGGGYWRRA